MNAWTLQSLAKGFVPDAGVLFATEASFLVIFVLITWGFGHFSSLLFVFLLDINLLYALKVAGHLLDTKAFAIPIALLLKPVTGRRVFPLGTPVFRRAAKPPVDLSARTALVATCYAQRKETGGPVRRAELLARLATLGEGRLKAELAYLGAQGVVESAADADALTPAGIHLWEKHVAG